MTQTNRIQVAHVMETAPGTTPGSPRMRKARVTSATPRSAPSYLDPEEVRDDRMLYDPILNFTEAALTLAGEFSYPVDETFLSNLIRSAMFADWTNTPQRDNDGTADSVITDVAATGGVFTVTTGAAFVVGQLMRTTGFTNAANNGLFKITTGSATVPAVGGSVGIVNETAPPGTARMKVVGFEGASGDITATATGLGSTALDFTTLGIPVGAFVKIGGTGAGFRFATAALNDWARVTAVAATALTLDHLPAGWTTDNGAGKTIRVFYGDQIKNGLTQKAMTLELGFLGQQTPSYLVDTGMTVGRLSFSVASKGKITWNAELMGMGHSEGTSALDASPDAAPSARVMAGNVNVGRVWEGGSKVGSPNWCREFSLDINNNLRGVEDVSESTYQGIREGDCMVTGRANVYFGDLTYKAKFTNGTASVIASRWQKDSQAVIWQSPRITHRTDGNPTFGGKNQDSMLPLGFQASVDTLLLAHVACSRIEYFEA